LETAYVISVLKDIKDKYKNDGFNVLALFGSYSTNSQKESSDIDILYDVNDTFLEKFKGFSSASKVLEIQDELSNIFHKKVDLTSPSGLSESVKKDIQRKAIYV